MAGFAESEVEQATLGWLQEIGWSVLHGPDIAPDTPDSERADYGDVVLALRLRDSLARLNLDLPASAVGDVFRKPSRPEGALAPPRQRVQYVHEFRPTSQEGSRTIWITSATALVRQSSPPSEEPFPPGCGEARIHPEGNDEPVLDPGDSACLACIVSTFAASSRFARSRASNPEPSMF